MKILFLLLYTLINRQALNQSNAYTLLQSSINSQQLIERESEDGHAVIMIFPLIEKNRNHEREQIRMEKFLSTYNEAEKSMAYIISGTFKVDL